MFTIVLVAGKPLALREKPPCPLRLPVYMPISVPPGGCEPALGGGQPKDSQVVQAQGEEAASTALYGRYVVQAFRSKCRGILRWMSSTGVLHFHRHWTLSWLVDKGRYSQPCSGSCRVTHSREAFVHMAIHKMLRVTCQPWYQAGRARPSQAGSLEGIQYRRKPNGY